MSGEQLDAAIQTTAEQLARTREEMNAACREFVAGCREFIPAWWKTEVEKTVTSKPDVAERAGSTKLGQMKAELRQLGAEAAELVDKNLDQDQHWPHRREVPMDPPFEFQHGALDPAVRKLLAPAGSLLHKFGFLDLRTDPWEAAHAIPSRPFAVKYRYGFAWSTDMNSAHQRYAIKHKELMNLDRKQKDLLQKKAEAHAKKLWEDT